MSIGSNIRRFRQAKKMTMKNLADAADVTVSLICQIENDKANPSVNTLLLIAKALGENVSHFFDEDDTPSNAYIVRHQDLFPVGSTRSGRRMYYLTHRNLETLSVTRIVMEPGSSTPPEQNHPQQKGYEFAYILRGKLRFEISGDIFLLEAGDAITFEAEKPHKVTNITDEEVEAIWVIIPGVKGE